MVSYSKELETKNSSYLLCDFPRQWIIWFSDLQ